jgi:uncharacterized membrane protein YphA (DoxX/SURF4 family)
MLSLQPFFSLELAHCGFPEPKEKIKLQRLFSRFPGGAAGAALMLLRLTAGLTLATPGLSCLAQADSLTAWGIASGALAVVFSLSLILGFLTPIAAGLVGLDVIGMRLSWFPPPTAHTFDTNLPTMLVVSIAAALTLLGPGAFSIDARLFGRREIIIPYAGSAKR